MTDILEPELVWVDDRCYRVCDKSASFQKNELKSYVEETYEPVYDIDNEEYCDNPIEIVPYRGNRLKHSFHVNSHFYRFIIGSKGATLKRLQEETRTCITVPRQGQNGDIEITGGNERDIKAARTRIDLLIETSRSKLEFTHFISIPSNFAEMQQNFKRFKDDVLKNCGKGVRGMKEEMFQYPDTLHLTVVMLVLLDEEDRRKAIEGLETCKKNIVLPTLERNGPLSIEYRGVEIMNDDPSETQILYIQAHDKSGCLQRISDDIANYFLEQGLTRKQYDKVKLHVTAINTKFLMDETKGYYQKKITFDASYILQAHKNTYFGKANLSSIHLSVRHKTTNDGYYQASSKIEF